MSELEADATIDVSLGPLSGSHDTVIEDEIDTDIEGALDAASDEFEGAYPETAPLIEIEDVTTEWGAVTETVTEVQTTFQFTNPNAGTVIVLPESGFEGESTFNGIHMASWETDDVTVIGEDGEAGVGEDVIVESGETVERTFIVELDTQAIGDWFPTHVERNESTDIVWGSELVVEVYEDGALGEIGGELPISGLPASIRIPPGEATIDCDIHLHTGIFVDQDTDVQFQGCLFPTVEPGDVVPLSNGDDTILP